MLSKKSNQSPSIGSFAFSLGLIETGFPPLQPADRAEQAPESISTSKHQQHNGSNSATGMGSQTIVIVININRNDSLALTHSILYSSSSASPKNKKEYYIICISDIYGLQKSHLHICTYRVERRVYHIRQMQMPRKHFPL